MATLVQCPGGKQGPYAIPDSVTRIGIGAFGGCSSLTGVTIPHSVINIDGWAFDYCYALTSVTIPNSVISIGICAFRGCKGLATVTIPNSVTSIGIQAFCNCTKLIAAYFLGNAPTGTSDMFAWGAPSFTVYYLSGATGWTNPWHGYPTAVFVPSTYTLTVNMTGSGSIAKSPSAASYASGTVVTLTAIPAAGYTFTGWSGDLTGTTNPTTVTMSTNRSVTAFFQAAPTIGTVQLSSLPNGATVAPGSITFSWSPASNATRYEFVLYNHLGGIAADNTAVSGTSVTYTLGTIETVTWKVRGGDNSGNWGAWSSTWNLIVQPAAPSYTLATTASPSTGGTITRSPDATSYALGTVVTLTAIPATGYTFAGWSGDLTGTTNPTTVTMNANGTVTATYQAVELPHTTATVLPSAPDGLNGFYITHPHVTITAGSTAIPSVSIYYHINSGGGLLYSGPVQIPDGTVMLSYYGRDAQGNQEQTNALTLKVDTTPPTLTITSPSDGTTTTSPQATLRGTATDAGSGLDYITVNGTRVSVSYDAFYTTLTLTPGPNTVFVSAWDKAGNKTEKTLTLTYQQGTVLVLTIGSTVATRNGGTVSLDTAPIISAGRTLVPLRFIAEAFGIEPIWDGTRKIIKLALSGGRMLWMQIGNKANCYVEWVGTSRIDPISLDSPPIITNGRTLVPIRFIAEQLGAQVDYDSTSRTVTITWNG